MELKQTDAGEMHTRILDTAEALLRRHGVDKLTVTDVAKALNMSHGNVYRHIPSKAALRAAVVDRWLRRVAEQTDEIAKSGGPAERRLRDWLIGLAAIKQRKVAEDAEMLLAAAKTVNEAPDVEHAHSARLTAQVVQILQDGLEDGSLPRARDPESTASAILNATFRFHHPDLIVKAGAPGLQMVALEEIVNLILNGLK